MQGRPRRPCRPHELDSATLPETHFLRLGDERGSAGRRVCREHAPVKLGPENQSGDGGCRDCGGQALPADFARAPGSGGRGLWKANRGARAERRMRVPSPAPRDDSREGRSHAAAAARRWKGAAGLAAASLPPLAPPPVSSVCLCPSVPCEDAVPGVRATCSRATASQILHVIACAQTASPDEVPCLA